SLGQYCYPRMTYRVGKEGNLRALWNFGIKFSALAVALTGLAALCAWVFLPHIVPVLVPKYVKGLRAAQVILIAGALEGTAIVASALLAINAWRLWITYQVLCTIFVSLVLVAGFVIVRRD